MYIDFFSHIPNFHIIQDFSSKKTMPGSAANNKRDGDTPAVTDNGILTVSGTLGVKKLSKVEASGDLIHP